MSFEAIFNWIPASWLLFAFRYYVFAVEFYSKCKNQLYKILDAVQKTFYTPIYTWVDDSVAPFIGYLEEPLSNLPFLLGDHVHYMPTDHVLEFKNHDQETDYKIVSAPLDYISMELCSRTGVSYSDMSDWISDIHIHHYTNNPVPLPKLLRMLVLAYIFEFKKQICLDNIRELTLRVMNLEGETLHIDLEGNTVETAFEEESDSNKTIEEVHEIDTSSDNSGDSATSKNA